MARGKEEAHPVGVADGVRLGKTVVFNSIAHDEPGNVLILAHRNELIEQARDKYRTMFGELPGKIKTDENEIRRVTVGSIQTMSRRRYAPELFPTIIVDEAHHAVSNQYGILYNSMLLTEGWDCPSVDCIIVLRPTRSRGLYQQMLGRGTRLFPGKDHLLVLDFLWLTEEHDLCRPSSLTGKSDKVKGKLDEMVENAEDAVDVFAAVEESEQEVLDEEARERELTLAKRLAAVSRRKGKAVDPIAFAFSIAVEDLAYFEPQFSWQMGPPSEKQLKFLDSRGIDRGFVENAGMASLLIDRLIKRQGEGLSTPKQIRLLERYGFRHVGMWSFEAASKMVSRISNAGWRMPLGINARTYVPA